jgi:aspartyl protease family protein
MSEEAPHLLYLLLLLALVGSAFFSRQLPLGKSLRMAVAWIAIFGAVFVLVAFRDDFGAIGQRLRAELTGEPVVAGLNVRIPISEDGHYWASGTLNGQDVRFLVDSGASTTTVSRSVAAAAGLEIGMRSEQVETANGTVVMKKSRASSLRIGSIERQDIGVNVSPHDNINVLGMNFLSSLAGWRVEGRFLVLEA